MKGDHSFESRGREGLKFPGFSLPGLHQARNRREGKSVVLAITLSSWFTI
jgi:hypothetical protein